MIYINQDEHNLYKTLGDVLDESNKKYEKYAKTEYVETYNDKDFDHLRTITNDKFEIYRKKFHDDLTRSGFRNNKKSKFSNLAKEIMLTNSNFNPNLSYTRRKTPSYDPYLMKVCKKAIINVKNELPNYKEIIKKINLEFDIPESVISYSNNNNDNMNIYINNIVPNENNQSTFQNNDSSIQNNQQSIVFTKGNSSTAETGYNLLSEKNKSQM